LTGSVVAALSMWQGCFEPPFVQAGAYDRSGGSVSSCRGDPLDDHGSQMGRTIPLTLGSNRCIQEIETGDSRPDGKPCRAFACGRLRPDDRSRRASCALALHTAVRPRGPPRRATPTHCSCYLRLSPARRAGSAHELPGRLKIIVVYNAPL
jgi:hypothetical protein